MGGGVAAYCLYQRMDDEVRCRVVAKIAGHYKDFKVTARSAHLVEGKGIKVSGLAIVDPRATGPRAELLHIEEAFLECPTDWKDLIQGDPVVRRVTIRRSTLRATRRADGSWTTAQLLPPPNFGDHAPEVVLEEGTIEMADAARPDAASTVLRDINWTMMPVPSADAGGNPHMRRLRGVLTAEGVRRLEIDGLLNLKSPFAAFRGRAQAVEFSPEWRDSLPEPAARRLTSLGDLYGHGDLSFEVKYEPSNAKPLQFHVTANMVRGRLSDPRLPQSLSDIRATVEVDNDGFTINNLAARCGQASLQMSCRRGGFDTTSPLSLVAEVHRLDLDRSLLAILPAPLQEMWRKYLPAGQIDADVKLQYDGQVWRPDVSVRCLNVSFSHFKFPYRLEHGKGTVVLKDDLLTAKMTALAGSQPVDITAEISRPLSAPTGWFEARGDEVPVDETLVSALPEKSREVVTSLDPRGRFGFYVRMWRDAPEQAMHQHVVLSMNRCSVRYQKFPYQLTNIRGILEMLDGTWTMRHIEGNNGTARVSCKGHLTPGFAGNELVLNFTARDVPLEEELRNALSPHMQQVWHNLRPRGLVNLTAEVRYLPEQHKFNVTVRAEPHRDVASLEPVHFPYRLDKIQGVLLYRDGQVTVQNAKAEHGTVKFASQVQGDFQPDGRWQVRLEGLTIDRLRPDRELIQALPERLRKVVTELNATGSVNLAGTVDLENSGRLGDPLRSRWEVRVGLHQNNIDCHGLRLNNLCGELSLQGGFDGANVRSRGELALDSVTHRDIQLTRVMGPIWIDDGRLLFGAWVDRQDNRTAAGPGPGRMPRPVTASLYGGTLYGDGWVAFGQQPRYCVNATLTDADLARCAKDLAPGQQRLQGKILATADLSGNGFTRNSLSGRGTVRLSQGDVYELPVMISLLKLVSIRPPDQNGFSDATIDYRIEGEHIYFDRIDFHGDAISLRGKGEMDFQSSIRLTFHALVGRGDLAVPVIKQVFSGASQQLMLIHVDGTLQNPETRKEALPYVNQALQQIREELQNRR